MKIFEKVRIKLNNGKSRLIEILDIPVLQYDKIEKQKTKYYIPFLTKQKSDNSKPIVYLKVNRTDNVSLACFQQWINIVHHLGYDFYVLCDKKDLAKKILKNVTFYNSNIKFIKSCKNSYLKNIVKNIATPYWINATYAHLTTYYHASKNNFKSFWNIDADDTMFLLDAYKTAIILKHAENYAKNNLIENFSLDMHRSNIRGHHWSFGITYTENPVKWLNIFNQNDSIDWQKKYIQYDSNFNLDWFMTFLKDEKFKNKIAVFCVENLYFAHWANLFNSFLGIAIYHWHNNILEYPILKELFKAPEIDHCPIFEDVVKLNIDLKDEDYKNFYENKIINLNFIKHIYNVWKG